MAFFRGSDELGLTGEDALAAQIAQAGNQWSSDNWRKEDMTAYMFRLYLEWARLVSPKRGLMDFEFTTEPVYVTPPSEAQPTAVKPRNRGQMDALEKLRVTKPVAKREVEEVVVEQQEQVQEQPSTGEF